MSLNEIRKLGDPILTKVAKEVKKSELSKLQPVFEKMWRLVLEFREKYGRGRAIAAPQVGVLKRIIAINTDKEYILINPVIEWASDEMIDIWDDCMSFPDLLVKVKRHKALKISFLDANWERVEWDLTDDMAELIQHEYDHLDGILALDRAEDSRSFKWAETHV